MIRRPPRSTQSRSSAASDVYKRQVIDRRIDNAVIRLWIASLMDDFCIFFHDIRNAVRNKGRTIVVLCSGFYWCIFPTAPFGPRSVINGDIVFSGQVHCKCQNACGYARPAGGHHWLSFIDAAFFKAQRQFPPGAHRRCFGVNKGVEGEIETAWNVSRSTVWAGFRLLGQKPAGRSRIKDLFRTGFQVLADILQ